MAGDALSTIVQVEPEVDKVIRRKGPPCPLVNGRHLSSITSRLLSRLLRTLVNVRVSAVLAGYIGFLAATGFGFAFRGLPDWYKVTGGILLGIIFLLLLIANQTDPGYLPKRTAKGGFFIPEGSTCMASICSGILTTALDLFIVLE